ncbi:unnamed protein product [Pleuronectes platessa]|uniref:Uncharacterized protein n=1 Tax=Pleuronectes platessa TaxID=8262 RepID=A0A9N7W3E3_PLEPL|nr:unnamed protein product [Pleuronectes platessa]
MDEVEFLDLYCCRPPGGDKAHVAPVADVSRDTPTPSSLTLSAAQGTKDRDMLHAASFTSTSSTPPTCSLTPGCPAVVVLSVVQDLFERNDTWTTLIRPDEVELKVFVCECVI